MADCRRARHRSADSFIAVAIAFHRESPATEPAGADYPDPFVDIESADDPQIPPDPDISLPPPPPPTVDFIEAHDIEPSLEIAPDSRAHSRAETNATTCSGKKAWAVNAPRPDYQYEARSRRLAGSGSAIISVDPMTGFASNVKMEQSIGNPILDSFTVSAFRRWRFKPGLPSRVRIPITFFLTGAQY